HAAEARRQRHPKRAGWPLSRLSAGLFPPQRPLLRLDNHAYSPAAWRLIAQAAGRLGSFADAAFALGLAGLPLSPQHVRTLAQEVGVALAQQRDAKAAQGRRRVPVRVAPT